VLFDGTPNFELVLGELLTSIKVLESLGQDAGALYERYVSIQAALGHAVREVHLRQSAVPPATLATIREELERFEWAFTTSYDLLVYWAMAQPTWRPFVDLFNASLSLEVRGGHRASLYASVFSRCSSRDA
jgi:hypothetical protein